MKIYDDQLIIITGGAGFIGSCLIRHLNDQGLTNIIVVDELGQTEKWKNLVGKCVLEVLDKRQLFNWLEGKESLIEAIFHLGACSNTMETDASYLLENNYQYSIKLAEYALKFGHRFVYASSAATYGNGEKGFSDQLDDVHVLEPLNMYGFSKQLFDQWAFNQGVLDKLVGLKYFNVFGPNENHKGQMASAITRMVPQILKDQPVRLFKSSDLAQYSHGEQRRDFVYVKDVVKMTLAFLKQSEGGLYNIGSGVASTWNQLARAVYKALKKEPNIEYIDMPRELLGKYQSYSCADLSKTRQAIQDQAYSRPLDEAVEDYVCNYLILDKRW